ncbi:hypothetical protein AURDEDRAFT_110275 [Auricularia subglabra TFB-10046 SS5]|nr:hypothetical protein AURDEDRAFT_110275 [Auricularia subglabra TFB-10046 SS5]
MAVLSGVLPLSLLVAVVSAQQTAVLADDKKLKYSAGNWKTGASCQYDKDGNFEPGQAGCFNLGKEPCADSFQYTNEQGASVELSFKGTGIALNTLTQPDGLPTNVTVTLDGEHTSYTSEVIKGALSCQAASFLRGELDEDAEHTIIVKITDGNAPAAQDGKPFLAIHSFTIVTGDAPDNATETTGSDSGPTSTPPPNAANSVARGQFAVIFAALLAFVAFA